MIILGTHNPGHNVVGSQLKIYIRPVETFPQPSREWPWQPCRKGRGKGRVGITVLALWKTKQKIPKRTQAKQKANTDRTKGKIMYHAHIFKISSSLWHCNSLLILRVRFNKFQMLVHEKEIKTNIKCLSQRNIQFNLTSPKSAIGDISMSNFYSLRSNQKVRKGSCVTTLWGKYNMNSSFITKAT